MQQNYFSDKNILYLLADNNQYLNFVYDELKKRLSIYRFDAFEYPYKNGIRNTEKYIENLISEKKIDILFTSPFAINYHLSVDFYAFLKNKVKIIFWMWDDEAFFDVYSKYYSQIADAVITCDYFSVFGYEKFGILSIFYPPCQPTNIFYPVKTIKDIDVCYIGSCCQSNSRIEYINFLINNGVNIETFGIGSKNGFIEWHEFTKILSRSKIVLNFNRLSPLDWVNKDEPLLNRVRQSAVHYAESALAKSFCLAEYTPSIPIVAEVGKEVDVFYNKKELLEKVKYYLSNPVKRDEIANNAYKRAINNYVPEIVIPKILKELENILQKDNKLQPETEKQQIFLSKAFKIKSINCLTLFMFVMIKHKKIKYALELFKELFKYGIFIFFAGFYGGILRAIETKFRK